MTVLACVINIVIISFVFSVIIWHLTRFLEKFYDTSEVTRGLALPLFFSCIPILIFVSHLDFTILHRFGISIPMNFFGICYLIALSLIFSMYLIIHVHIVWEYACNDI